MTAGSSGWLADEFAEDPSRADGLFNYESVLKSATWDGSTPVIIAPSDGVVTADYPLTLFKGADEETAEAYSRVVDYLTSPEVQQRISDETHRRTSASDPADFASTFETPYPAKLNTVQSLLQTWLADARKPATMFFQIDTSGSMAGNRLTELQDALGVLSGTQAVSQTDSLLALQPREKLTVVEFGSGIKSEESYDMSEPGKVDDVRAQMDRNFGLLEAYGKTDLYSTLQTTVEKAAQQKTNDSFTSVVVFTDGANTGNVSADQFITWYNENSAVQGVPVFAISFGEADTSELDQIAQATGGRVFSADQDLTGVFKEIRGYL